MKKTTTTWALAFAILGFAGVAWAAEPAAQPLPASEPAIVAPVPAEEVVPVEIDGLETDAACEEREISTAESTLENGLVDTAGQAAACKPCKGRTWCKCTYNGQQRSSCDPCCYRNNIGFEICLD